MKSILQGKNIFSLLFAVFCCGTAFSEDIISTNLDKSIIVVADVGFSTPESVEYYADEDVYLVSNINGSPFAADGNGFISKIKPDGSVIDIKWIDGSKQGIRLNAPKGSAVIGRKLYVADINQIHIFELPGGKQLKSITIEGSTFLNGVTPGAGDYVYVTDSGYGEGYAASGTDAIYKVWGNGKYKAILRDKDIGRPNGILVDGRRLLVVTRSGKIISVDESGGQSNMPTAPTDRLDGLIKLKDGRFLISSWGGSAIFALNKDNTFSLLADSLDAPADLGFDARRNRVLIPLFKQNKVILLPL